MARRPPPYVLQRRTQAVALTVGGLSLRQVAEALAISPATAQRDVAAATKEWREERLADLDLFQTVILMRYEALFRKLWVPAQEGDVAAASQVISILKAVTAMLGLNSPTRLQMDGPVILAFDDIPPPDLSRHSDTQLLDILRQGGAESPLLRQVHADPA